jgi:two-component response regulator ARR-B family
MTDGAVKPEPQADLGGSGGSSQLPGFPSGLRVLVVDDDPTCLMVVSAMLKKCNYEGQYANVLEGLYA